MEEEGLKSVQEFSNVKVFDLAGTVSRDMKSKAMIQKFEDDGR